MEDLAYDLRQKYAEIVGIHLETVSRSRMSKDYPAYFQALEDLFTVIKHKFKKKKKGEKDDSTYILTFSKEKKGENKTDLERFYSLRQIAIDKANNYSTVYFGQTDDPKQVVEIERAFRELEMFLFHVMDDANMFGRTGYNEGM